MLPKRVTMRHILIAVLGLFMAPAVNAQKAANYNFTSSGGTFTSIANTSGAVLMAKARATSGAGASLDDTVMTLATSTIPFSFTFDSASYTGLRVSSNGFITFGNTAPSTTNYTPLSSTASYTAAISAFALDLNGVFVAGDTAQVWYKTEGTSPNREFVVEWKNFKNYSTSTNNIFKLSFQIRLKEDNSIRIVYYYDEIGSPTSTPTAQVGLRGPTNTFATNVNNRMLVTSENTWATSYPATSNSSTMTLSSTLKFSNGLTYTWTQPPTCSGTPSVSNIMGKSSACSSTLNLYNNTANNFSYGMSYDWQVSTNGTNFNTVSSGTVGKGTYSLSGYTPPIYFRIRALCSNSSDSGFSSVFSIQAIDTTNKKWASLPYNMPFDSAWRNGDCYQSVTPDSAWSASPQYGNNSWRRADQGVSTGGWSGNGGSYSPSGAVSSSSSARFHTYNASNGTEGSLYFYFDGATQNGNKQASFYYINTDGTDSLFVYLSSDSGATYSLIASYGQSSSWNQKILSLGNVNGKGVLRFRAISDYGNTDLGIDQFNIDLAPSKDLSVSEIVSPGGECLGDNTTVRVVVKNVSNSALNLANDTALLVTWLNNTPYYNHLNSGSLSAGDSVIVTVTTTWATQNTGTYSVAPYIQLPGDGTNGNDSIYRTFDRDSVYVLDYSQNFNSSGPSDWSFSGFSYQSTYGVSGSGAYRHNLYYNSTFNLAESPLIGPLSSASFVGFYYRAVDYNTGGAVILENGDSIFVWVSTDCGNSFTRIYSIDSSTHTPTAGYTYLELPLGAYSGENVRIYINGTHSGNSNGNDYYFAFDDFRVFDKPQVDIGITELTSPSDFDCEASDVPISVTLKNDGLGTRDFSTDPVYVTLSIIGAQTGVIVDTLNTGTLASGSSMVFTFDSAFTFTQTGTYGLRTWVNTAGDPNQQNDSSGFRYIEFIYGSNLPYNQGFENLLSLANWRVEQLNGSGNWNVRTTSMSNPTLSAHGGSNILYFNSYSFSTGVVSRASSPCIDLRGIDYPVLDFYLSQSDNYPNSPDSVYVQYSLDGGATWVSASGFTRLNTNASTPFWALKSVCLPQLANRDDVRIALLGISGYGDNLAIDDMTLRNMNLSIGMNVANDTLCVNGKDSLMLDGLDGTSDYALVIGSDTLSMINAPSGSSMKVALSGLDTGMQVIRIQVKDTLTGCDAWAKDSLVLIVKPAPVVNLGPDRAVCDGDSVQLDAGSGFKSYIWNTSDNTSQIWVGTSGTYSVNVADNFGCRNSDSLVLTVNPLPMPNLGRDTSTCQQSPLTLDPGSYTHYLWSTLDTNRTISVNTPGTYIVGVEDQNGCRNADSIMITVFNNPTVSIQDQTICADSVAYFDAGPGFSEYFWFPGGDTTQSIIRTVSTGVTVRVTDANGCYATDSAYVTVNPLPNVSLGPDSVVCDGNSVVLNAGNYTSYSWSTGSGAAQITVDTTGDYSVWVSDMNGCRNGDTIRVAINDPNVDLGPDLNACEGDTLLLDAGAGFSSFLWSTFEQTQTIRPVQSGLYSVVATDADGCEAGDSIQIFFYNLPNVYLGPDTAICSGQSIVFMANAGASYLWNTGDTTSSITVNNAGNYSVAVTDQNGCKGSDEISLSLNPLPNPTFIFTDNGNKLIDFNAADTLKFYLWQFGDGDTSTQDDPTHQYPAGNTYTVKLIVADSNGCVDSSEQSLDLTFVRLAGELDHVRIYPNPSTGTVYLNTGFNMESVVEVSVYDAQGKLLSDIRYTAGSGEFSEPLDLSTLTPGTYMMRIRSGDRVSSFRIIRAE